MTKTTAPITKAIAAALSEIPYAGGEHQPLPDALLPEALRPLADVCRTRQTQAVEADAKYRAARATAARADADHRAALADAARHGEDPEQVVDERPAKRAAAQLAEELKHAAESAAGESWYEYCVSIIGEHRDAIDATARAALAQLQARATELVNELTATEAQMRAAAGVSAWVTGLSRPGAFGGLSTSRGARFLPATTAVVWRDRRGKSRGLEVREVLTAATALAHGADRLTAARELDANRAARIAGDRAAATAPVPRGRITVG